MIIARHKNLSSLIRESIIEYLVVADYCVNYRKDEDIWGAPGCFGYPSTILLMSIADSIGSYVIEGDCVEDHFKILNEVDYYNFNLSEEELRLLYKHHRCLLNHNAGLSLKVGLGIGDNESKVVEWKEDGKLYLNLKPFLESTKLVVKKFFDNDNIDNIIENSNQSKKVLNKN